MKRAASIGLVVAIIWAGTATAAVFSRPKGQFKELLGALEYDSGKSCYKPMRLYGSDRTSREIYISDAKRYVQCMNDAADSDLKYAEEVILDGHKKATDRFLMEVRTGY